VREFKAILVTGGAGFIGSNFIRHIFSKKNFYGIVVNVDKLTYAGNLENLSDIKEKYQGRYFFEKADICDINKIKKIFNKFKIDAVAHFAAESHVDRSIEGPKDFIDTNIFGTFNLLEILRTYERNKDFIFYHISTDEVFGSLGNEGYFYETTPYSPRSPYSASKAASDHLVMAYHHTYGLPVVVSNCSNNYGQYQYPEKIIPLMIANILSEKELPVYGDGKNIRDWLYVTDHCEAIWQIITKGTIGETYNIGGENEWQNIDLVNVLCEKMAIKLGKEKDYYKKLIKFVPDRSGHDRRYAINCDKIKKTLGWKQSVTFDKGLDLTIDWILSNKEWIKNIQNKKEYKKWIISKYKKKV